MKAGKKCQDPSGPVSSWSCEDVEKWLIGSGFSKYSEALARTHCIDGQALLLLSENDLRLPPVSIACLGDILKLSKAIEALKSRHVSAKTKCLLSDDKNQKISSNDDVHPSFTISPPVHESTPRNSFSHAVSPSSESLSSVQSFPGGGSKHRPGDLLIHQVEAPDTRTKSLIKLAIASLYCTLALLLTAFVMVIVHDRVPDMKTYPPLPDLILDNVPLIPWAFQLCEVLACILGCVWFLVLFFHKHRVIVMRRMFSLTGTVFLLRCVTMLITSLSVPGTHHDCRANPGPASLIEKFQEAFRIWSGMGMSLNGVRTCGDYMFSGHTTAITLLNHFITEYTPEGWHFLHTSTWVMNLFGIFFILAAHEHYSIDVFVAFYISSRLFLYYHSMAHHAPTAARADERTRMWFPLMWFFESGSPGRIANEYEWPFPSVSDLNEDYFKPLFSIAAKIRVSHEEHIGNNVAFKSKPLKHNKKKNKGD